MNLTVLIALLPPEVGIAPSESGSVLLK